MKNTSFKSFKLFSKVQQIILFTFLSLERIFHASSAILRKNEYDSFQKKGYLFHRIKGKIQVTYKNFVFNLRNGTSDWDVFVQVYINKEYHPIVSITKSLMLDPKIIVDAGSNIGLTSLYFSSYFKNAKFYCIEPENGNFAILKNNIDSNQINAICLNAALWDNSSNLSLVTNFRDSREWAFRVDENPGKGEIKGISLTDLIKENEIQIIDVLKIDIEGAESIIFESPSIYSILSLTKIVVIEIHEEIVEKSVIHNILGKCQYFYFESGEHTIAINRKFFHETFR